MGQAHRFPLFLRGLAAALLLLAPVAPLPALEATAVELRHGETNDGAVTLTRDGNGNLVLDDAAGAPVTLSTLRTAQAEHGALVGLAEDHHPQYLNATRHTAAHTASFNGALPIPEDPSGNVTLGAHVQDDDLHLRRGHTEAITAVWDFAVGLSAAGGAVRLGTSPHGPRPALLFEEGADDAELSYDPATGLLAANRTVQAPRLRVAESLSGLVAGTPTATLSGFASIEGIAAADLPSTTAAESISAPWAFVAPVTAAGGVAAPTVELTGLPQVVLRARLTGTAVSAGSPLAFHSVSGGEVIVTAATWNPTPTQPIAGIAGTAAADGALVSVVMKGVATVTAGSVGAVAGSTMQFYNGAFEPDGNGNVVALEDAPPSATVRVWVNAP